MLYFFALVVSGVLMAQGSKSKVVPKSFIALHPGLSVPTAEFNRKDANDEKAGYAQPGFTINLDYGYDLSRNVGLSVMAFYGRHNLDKTDLFNLLPGVNVDHWQYFGIMAGPRFYHSLSDKAVGGFRMMVGVNRVNSPEFTYEGTPILAADWAWSAVYMGGVDARFTIADNFFIFTSADYRWTEPEFKLKYPDGGGSNRAHQNVSVFNLTGGVGMRF